METYAVGFKFHNFDDGHNYVITKVYESLNTYLAEQSDPDKHFGIPLMVSKYYSAETIKKHLDKKA